MAAIKHILTPGQAEGSINVDELLIKQHLCGDSAAFGKLYNRHAAGALRLARVITRDDQLAADAVQEAFLRAYRYLYSLKPGARFDLWLKKIVVNESRRQLVQKSKVLLLGETPLMEGTVEDTYPFEANEALYSSIEKLPELLRTAVALKYLCDLSENEMSAILGTNKNTVKSRLYQARQKLKDMIRENEE